MTAISIYRMPGTAAEMRPPKESSLITEAANFLRSHWDEVKPYYQAMSGETPSEHGSHWLEEAACVFKIKEIARNNGYAFLATIETNRLRKALRFALKRNTGIRMHLLAKQYRTLLLEHRMAATGPEQQQQPEPQAEPAEPEPQVEPELVEEPHVEPEQQQQPEPPAEPIKARGRRKQ